MSNIYKYYIIVHWRPLACINVVNHPRSSLHVNRKIPGIYKSRRKISINGGRSKQLERHKSRVNEELISDANHGSNIFQT